MTDSGLALLFPGQGSQHVGMGRALADALPEAAETFREADEILGFELSRVMWDGPEDELVATHTAQPAILTHSIAVLRVVSDRLGPVSMAAGHSLGEFSAHVAAGTLAFADALRAVRLRGMMMHEAGTRRAGTMAAVLGLDDQVVEDVCARASEGRESVVVPANFNAPGQVVISGDTEAVERAGELAADAGARKVVPLSVSGAFHSPLMDPARAGLEDGLRSVEFNEARYPVYANVTARPVVEPDEAHGLLLQQITAPVRWSQTVTRMVEDGATRFVELGPGSVLRGLGRRIARDVPTVSLGEPGDLAAFDGTEG